MPVIATLRMPELYPAQAIFQTWTHDFPEAQVLMCPSGTKVGKTFGAACWMAGEALCNIGLYCIWIAPTIKKAKIGYRYVKAMVDGLPGVKCVDSALEIRFGNRSFISFIHGKDAEVTIEGEAVDRFVIDETGKISRQVYYSLITTITQTRGLGIVTGTPRGYTWYYEEFRKAKAGDSFYAWAQLRTIDSPYISAAAVARARRILPKALYDQYFEALFVSMSSVFGDVNSIFDESLKVDPMAKFWIHPDPAQRDIDTVTGWDIAKQRDRTVFYTTNTNGVMVGYARFNKVAYPQQVDRLKAYLDKFFTGDKMLRYDATGVGSAVGDLITQADIDASVTAVVFSQRSKQEMVSRTTIAIEQGWHKAPRIEQIQHEFGSYSLKITSSGLMSYSAPEGEHDDVVCAAMLSISGAYQLNSSDESEKYLERVLSMGIDENDDDDTMQDAADEYSSDESDDDFFTNSNDDEDDNDFDMDYA